MCWIRLWRILYGNMLPKFLCVNLMCRHWVSGRRVTVGIFCNSAMVFSDNCVIFAISSADMPCVNNCFTISALPCSIPCSMPCSTPCSMPCSIPCLIPCASPFAVAPLNSVFVCSLHPSKLHKLPFHFWSRQLVLPNEWLR